jgi:hypothetical protein
MSVQDDAAALIAAGETFFDAGIAISTSAATSMSEGSDTLQRIRDLATNSMATVHNLLGTGHPGVGTVGATANSVAQKANDVITAIQQAIGMIMELDQEIGNHSGSMRSVGTSLMGGS